MNGENNWQVAKKIHNFWSSSFVKFQSKPLILFNDYKIGNAVVKTVKTDITQSDAMEVE